MMKNRGSSTDFIETGPTQNSESNETALTNLSLEMRKIDSLDKKEERGLLGKLWGAKEHSSNNIAGLFIFLLLLACFVYTVWSLSANEENSHSNILEFWKTLSPFMTLSLGYIFGKSIN